VSYTVFARKYRPQTFDEIVGQEHIVRTLKNAIEQGRLAQAYLFVGPRGTGKTSTARIFAKALNCVKAPTVSPCGVCDMCKEIAAGNSLNVLEFDAASNTQVDKIREIILDTVKFAPSSGKYKLYIVDEVHMLSASSFNALLKTLEEPPAHVKFVFATTDVQKVPTTIVSRCQRFDLQRIAAPAIAKHLLFIAGKEQLTLSPEAADAIARGAEGGLRDAESMLDQLVAFCGDQIDEANVLEVFGFTSQHTISTLSAHILAREAAPTLALVHQQAEAGKDLSRLLGDLITHCRNLLVVKADPNGLSDEFSAEAVAALGAQAESVPMEKLLTLIEQFAAAESRMKWAANKKMHIEVAVIRAIQTLGQATLDEVLDTLTTIRGGGSVERPKPEARSPKPELVKPVAPSPVPVATPPRSLSAAVATAIAKPSPPPSAPAPAVVREEPAAPPPRAAAVPAASIPAVADLWPQVVARIRKERPLVLTWVQSGTLLGIEGDTALIGFPPEADLAREACDQPKQRGFLEDILSSLAGQRLVLRCVKREGLVVQPIAFAEEPRPQPKDPMADFKDDPLILRAIEEFKAEVVAEKS
jgi:DNA polymerase-3 subunit gamma/tau